MDAGKTLNGQKEGAPRDMVTVHGLESDAEKALNGMEGEAPYNIHIVYRILGSSGSRLVWPPFVCRAGLRYFQHCLGQLGSR